MAAEVESLFYVTNDANGRFVPWHGLGTPVPEALTSKEALEKSGLNWTVSPKKLLTAEGIEVPNYVANVRDTDNSVLGVVTDRYQLVQNEEAFAFTDSLVDEGITYETAGSLRDGKKIWLLAKMPETKIIDDAVEPYICFSNSHDGTGAVKVCMTPIRVVCNNTLNMALENAKRSWSCKHTGDISSKMEEAKYTLGLAKDYMTALNEEAYRLADKKISDEQFMDILNDMFPETAADSARKIANIREMKDKMLVCWLSPDILKYRNTAYAAVNAASDFATHIAPKRASSTYAERNWNRVMDGHYIIDTMLEKVKAI